MSITTGLKTAPEVCQPLSAFAPKNICAGFTGTLTNSGGTITI